MKRQDISHLLYDDDFSGGMVKHKSAKRVNEAGQASAMAMMRVSQAAKEKELEQKSMDMQKESLQAMMSTMMAKQQAEATNQELLATARQLAMQQAILDGKLAAQAPPPLPPVMPNGMMPPEMMPPDMAMGGDPMLPPTDQGMPMPPDGGMMPPPDAMPSGVPADQVTPF